MVETAETPNTGKNDTTPFTSLSALVDVHSHLLQQEPAIDERPKYFKEVEEFLHNVQATGAILDTADERYTAQSILNYWITVLYRNVAQVENAVPVESAALADYNPSLNLKMEDAQCPYPGVRAFREDENKLFFGRQRQINYLLSRLREDRLLAVVGPSGSGKTSIVLAGLLPEMQQADKASNTQRHYFPVISPGRRPLDSLNHMLQGSINVASAQSNGTQTGGFHRDTFHLLKRIQEVTPLPVVIVIDEFDEVFTRSNESDRHDFITNLARVIQAADTKHIVILTMRDDNYDSYLRRPERFRKALDPAKVSLPQLSSIDLRDAIEKPAAYVRLKFEESTIKALVKETISEPVGLTLLQFTLWKLWTRKNQDEDINVAFDHMKSCRKALADSAEEFFSKLDSSDQRACSRLVSALVTLDGDLRAYSYPAARSELYRRTESKSRVNSLIERLSQAQLVRLSKRPVPGDDQVELVHDSLIRTWPRMASWVAKKRNARWRARIAASLLLIASIGLVTLLVMLWWGQKQLHDESRDLARRSSKEFTNKQFDQALLSGRDAYAMEPNAATRGNSLRLLYALQSTSQPKWFLRRDKFEPDDMVFSAENKENPSRLAAVNYQGEIVIWNLASKSIESTLVSEKKATYPLAFSPDGKKLATASLQPGVAFILWDLENKQPTDFTQNDRQIVVTSLAFAQDGKTLVTGDWEGNVVQWDLRHSDGVEPMTLYNHRNTRVSDTNTDYAVSTILFTADGSLMASGGQDGTVILSDLKSKGGHRRTFAARGEVTGSASAIAYRSIGSLAFSPERNLLAASTGAGVFIWDIATGKLVEHFSSGPRAAGILVSFSQDGNLITGFSFDGAIILWDLRERKTVGRQFYNPGATYSAAFSNNGKLLAVPGDDGVVVWDVFKQRILSVDGNISTLAFTPGSDNKILAAGTGDGSLILWNTKSTDEHYLLGNPIKEASLIFSLAFSSDRNLLAAGLKDGTISLRDPRNLAEQIKVLDAQKGEVVTGTSSGETVVANEGTDAAFPAVAVSKVVFDPRPGSHLLAAVVVDETNESEAAEAENLKDDPSKIILWNTDEPSSSQLATEPDSVVTSLTFSPDGKFLAGGIADKNKNNKIVLWKDQKQEEVIPVTARVSSIAISQKPQILAAGLDNGQVLLRKLDGMRQQPDKLPEGVAGRVTDLAFSRDGKILAVVTNKRSHHPQPGVITLWDVETREPIGNPFIGHDLTIRAVALSGDGKILASGSGDEAQSDIILWDLDIDGADKRFCSIVDCPPVREKTWLQSLYLKISGWFR